MEDVLALDNIKIVNFYDENKDKELHSIVDIINDGYFIEHYSVAILSGQPYHSFLLLKAMPLRSKHDKDGQEDNGEGEGVSVAE